MQSHWEGLADVINKQLLGGRGANAVWFTVTTATAGFDVTNVVQFQANSQRNPTRSRRSRRAPATPHLDEQPSFVDPQFRFTTLTELERVIGAHVEMYPEVAYTESTINRWQRAGHTVDVVNDSETGLTPLLHALRTFDQTRTSDPRFVTARQACTELLHEIQIRLDYLDRMPWDDGITPTSRDVEDWPTLFAARLTKPTLTTTDRDLLSRHAD